MPSVKLPNGQIANFPEGLTPEQMQEAIKTYIPQPTMQTPGIDSTPQEGMAWGDVASQAAGNLWPSFKRTVGEITNIVTHPGETAESLWGLAKGIGQKFIPGEQEDEKYADAAMQYFKDRYFSGGENFKKVLAQDPVGFLSDLASVLTLGTAPAKIGAKTASLASKATGINALANAAEKLGGSTRFVDNLASYVDPLGAVTKGGTKIFDKVRGGEGGAAASVLQRSIKGPKKEGQANLNRYFQAAVDNRVPMTESGLEKLYGLIEPKTERINTLVKEADAAGKTIDPLDIAARLESKLDDSRISYDVGNSILNKHQYKNVLDNYLTDHGDKTSISDAQRLKTTTSKYIRDATKAFVNPQEAAKTGKLQARRDLVGELTKEIENASPEIAEVNKSLGPLLGLRNILEDVLPRVSNRNVLGLTDANLVGGLLANGSVPGAAALGVASSLGRFPGVRSQMAFMLDRMNKTGQFMPWQRALLSSLYGAGSERDANLYYNGK